MTFQLWRWLSYFKLRCSDPRSATLTMFHLWKPCRHQELEVGEEFAWDGEVLETPSYIVRLNKGIVKTVKAIRDHRRMGQLHPSVWVPWDTNFLSYDLYMCSVLALQLESSVVLSTMACLKVLPTSGKEPHGQSGELRRWQDGQQQQGAR